MSHKSSTLIVLFLLIAVAVPASSQVRSRVDPSSDGVWSAKPLVAVTALKDQVRLTALALTQRIRLEVLSQTGETLYDSDFHPGNRLEWEVKDQQGSELRDGLYGCLVTVADLNGQMSQRRAIFRVKAGSVSFDTMNREPAAAASEEQENLTILLADEPSPFTLVSHDGKEGWIESASGGLSLHAGSLSRSRDVIPHLRLTPEGNVGIGVEEPTAKLDVAGLIRTSEGILFPDGTVLRTATPLMGFAVASGVPGAVEVGASQGSSALRQRLPGQGPLADRFVGERRTLSSGSVGRVFGSETEANTFYGYNAGLITTGTLNSFFGSGVGQANTTGHDNSFFGDWAGHVNVTGYYNAFFGAQAGRSNTTGSRNSFFGDYAGHNNIDGGANAFFGDYAGAGNTSGYYNSFFGQDCGTNNTTGTSNSFFGQQAGKFNITGENNSAFGYQAGNHTTGNLNSFVGNQAGYSNAAGNENAFFGSEAGYSNTTANWNAFFGTYAGYSNTTGLTNAFFGQKAGYSNNTGGSNALFGESAGFANSSGAFNSFFGRTSGLNNTVGGYNTFVGYNAGARNTTESNNNFFGAYSNGAAGITNASAIGYRARVTQSNSLVLGSIDGVNGATASTNVGIGTTAPKGRLDVAGPVYSSAWGPLTGSGVALLYDTGGPWGMLLSYDSVTDHALDFAFRARTIDFRTGYYGNNIAMHVTDPGNVGIGTTNPTERLQVVGNLKVSGNIIYGAPEEPVPDYVFDSDYRLMPVEELQKYLQREKHLPNVPNSEEIKANGLNLGEFQMKLLEKIEELTLYTVQQEKTIREQQAKNSALEARLAAVEQMLSRQQERRQK